MSVTEFPPEPAIIIALQPLRGIPEEAAGIAQLEAHGCKLHRYDDRTEIIFPPGTERILDIQVTYTYWYHITLPDGWQLTEYYSALSQRSLLRVALPE